MINLAAKFERFSSPFTYYTIDDVISAEDLKRLNAEVPPIELFARQHKEGPQHRKNYQFDLLDLYENGERAPKAAQLPESWAQLLDSLLSPEFCAWASDGLGLDMSTFPLTLGLYRYGDRDYTTVDTAKATKAMHWALYLNDEWSESDGGRLNLWSAKEAPEPEVSILPGGGTCAMFAPTERTWHNIGKVTTGGKRERLTIMLEYWKP
ncbi:2OG-Fe(II) oxygenase [Amycolatopsis sp. cmx-4-61]|uniref:2OG-Fe(II) oxygenase n=1 Tax=Amycolatopsis sp. cmx-4-61 TaxID=2790937 RepID=UPI0039789025